MKIMLSSREKHRPRINSHAALQRGFPSLSIWFKRIDVRTSSHLCSRSFGKTQQLFIQLAARERQCSKRKRRFAHTKPSCQTH